MGERRRDFDAFAREFTPALVRFGRTLSGDRGRGEDLAQIGLVRVYERWTRLSGAEHDPVAYAKRVMVNREISWRRRPASWELVVDIPGTGSTPDRADELAARDALLHQVRELPPRQRAVIVLRYYEDLADREIAEMLGCRESTVRSLAAKGLAALRLTTPGQARFPEMQA